MDVYTFYEYSSIFKFFVNKTIHQMLSFNKMKLKFQLHLNVNLFLQSCEKK